MLLDGESERVDLLLKGCEREISEKIRVGFFGFWVTDIQVMVLRGSIENALSTLRQAVDQGWRTDWRYFFYVDPILDPIRDRPEFQAILKEVKEDMALQLERAREMETNGELAAIP